MARNGIQFRKDPCLPESSFITARRSTMSRLRETCWPDGFRCSRCCGHGHSPINGYFLLRKRWRSLSGHQATRMAGTIMQATKLPAYVFHLYRREHRHPAARIRQLQEAAELDGEDALEDPGGTHPGYESRIGAAQAYLHQGSQFELSAWRKLPSGSPAVPRWTGMGPPAAHGQDPALRRPAAIRVRGCRGTPRWRPDATGSVAGRDSRGSTTSGHRCSSGRRRCWCGAAAG